MGHGVTRRPNRETQVVLLNAHNRGANKFLRPSQVAQLKKSGKMNVLGQVLPKRIFLRGKRKGPILVHRVDGVSELVIGRRTFRDEIQPAVNRMVDHTIFQSEYCKRSFAEHCGFSPPSWRVVTNGTDPRLFFPDPESAWTGGNLRLVAASWSSNPRKGFAALAQVSRLPGVELTFAGNWCPDIDPASVKIAGTLDSRNLGALMRASHAMIHAAWNEPCSNAIVEAMACGLPVIFRDSGGSRELVGDYGVAMSDNLADSVDALKSKYVDFRRRVLDNREEFLISRAAGEYLSLFKFAAATPPQV